MGVTFTGWTPADPSNANIAPITTAPIKLLAYGVRAGFEASI